MDMYCLALKNVEYRIQTIDEILSLQKKLIVISKCVKFQEYSSGNILLA